MPHKRYLTYSKILNVIASLFGVVCVLYGIAFGLLWGPGPGFFARGYASRIVPIFVLALGVLYLIPNKRFSTKTQTLFYAGFTLVVSLAVLLLNLVELSQSADAAGFLFMMLTYFLPTLAAPASLFFYLKAYQVKYPA